MAARASKISTEGQTVTVILNAKTRTGAVVGAKCNFSPQTHICVGLLTQSLKMVIRKLLTEQSHANRSVGKVDFHVLFVLDIELSKNLPRHYFAPKR